MVSDKQGVAQFAEACIAAGLQTYVISPGSRNAPLIISLVEHTKTTCFSIIDERSAAYFALGMAQWTGLPVGLVSTSGTAVLNYAPALAEAYYQRIPLIAITADRPDALIDQREGQAIRQNSVYQNYVKSSWKLPGEPHDEMRMWHIGRIASEALHTSTTPPAGPVHINVPLREPLYGKTESADTPVKIIHTPPVDKTLPPAEIQKFADEWNNAAKIMILAGMHSFNHDTRKIFANLSLREDTVVLCEHLANLSDNRFFRYTGRYFYAIGEREATTYTPDILITIGKDLVSKQLKQFLRKYPPHQHWHIDEGDVFVDTYMSLTHNIPVKPGVFFQQILPCLQPQSSNYREIWQKLDNFITERHETFCNKAEWSDFKAFDIVLRSVPNESVLHTGNSSPVRYAQFFPLDESVWVYGNRGTSGIDGSISTAVGSAHISGRFTTIITGDLGFAYDSNALWNDYLSEKLCIIVINNQGGGIFRLIPGPADTGYLEKFFETSREISIKHIAETYNVNYYYADTEDSLREVLPEFYSGNTGAALLEIRTPRERNDIVFKEYIAHLSTVD